MESMAGLRLGSRCGAPVSGSTRIRVIAVVIEKMIYYRRFLHGYVKVR